METLQNSKFLTLQEVEFIHKWGNIILNASIIRFHMNPSFYVEHHVPVNH
jgi:hypothetical protein